MLERMWELLKGRQGLISAAWNDCLTMLVTDREMLLIVTEAMKQETDIKVREKVAAMDKQINAQQQEVRKKVFEHLVLSQGKDMLQGLQMLMIVIDLERIGDYGKNIAEVVDMVPSRLNFHQYEGRYNEVVAGTLEMFDLTLIALRDGNEAKAQEATQRYRSISQTCDGTLEEIVSAGGVPGDCIEQWKLGLVLILRYLKRVSAHLKNVCSSMVNPFHRIGYRPDL
jgi:phosphate uptake regulator